MTQLNKIGAMPMAFASEQNPRDSSMPVNNSPSPQTTVDFKGCQRLHRALAECHRRIPAGFSREAACRHLNRSLAECLVARACPQESDAVRTLCSSAGTALKRQQCHQAQLSLSVCLSYYQSGLQKIN